jgi:hypothetical protein
MTRWNPEALEALMAMGKERAETENPIRRGTSIAKEQAKSAPRKRGFRDRGPHGLSIPAAGAMVGLSRSAAYEAAKRGEIPVLKFGFLKIVPRALWLKQIGADEGPDARI